MNNSKHDERNNFNFSAHCKRWNPRETSEIQSGKPRNKGVFTWHRGDFCPGASSLRFPLMALYLFTWYRNKMSCRCHSDMCIPVTISLAICTSLQYGCQWNVYPLSPTPPNKCRFYFRCFCEFCESSSKGLRMIQAKSNDSRQNNRKAVSGESTSLWAAMLM